MDETKVAPAGSFCWNQACPDDGQVGKGNMRKNGKTPKERSAIKVKHARKRVGKPMEPCFTGVSIQNRWEWSVLRCEVIARVEQLFVGSKTSKKRRCVDGESEQHPMENSLKSLA